MSLQITSCTEYSLKEGGNHIVFDITPVPDGWGEFQRGPAQASMDLIIRATNLVQSSGFGVPELSDKNLNHTLYGGRHLQTKIHELIFGSDIDNPFRPAVIVTGAYVQKRILPPEPIAPLEYFKYILRLSDLLRKSPTEITQLNLFFGVISRLSYKSLLELYEVQKVTDLPHAIMIALGLTPWTMHHDIGMLAKYAGTQLLQTESTTTAVVNQIANLFNPRLDYVNIRNFEFREV